MHLEPASFYPSIQTVFEEITMRTKRPYSIIAAVVCTVVGTSACTVEKTSPAPSAGTAQGAASAGPRHAGAAIQSVVSITKVFADGQKVAAIAIKYGTPIEGASLSPSDFVVTTAHGGQKIIGIYATTDGAYFTKTNGNGPYVVLQLSTDYVIPVKTASEQESAGGRPKGPPGGWKPGGHEPPPPAFDLAMNPDVVTRVGDLSWNPAAHPDTLIAKAYGGAGLDASVIQVGGIAATDGMVIPADPTVQKAEYVRNLIVDRFLKMDYHENKHTGLKYDIYFPRDYDPAKQYPVVLSLVDSSDAGGTHASVLISGLGGLIWADKDAMAGQEAIVVVPSVRVALLNQDYQPAPDGHGAQPGGKSDISYPYGSILHLMDFLAKTVTGVDKRRIYVTGQGNGATAAIKMMIDRPDLFAGGLMFAPDYDPARMVKLAKDNLWIVSAQADTESYPDMEKGMRRLKAAGAAIDTAVWNGQDDAAQLAEDVERMIHKGGNIKFAVLKKGTVVPSGVADDEADIHAYTWRIGDSIPGLRNWLLSQSK